MVPSQFTTLAPIDFPTPIGSHWEKSDAHHWQLARFDLAWREAIRQLTAVRSLEVGVSSWEFITDTPYLTWTGRWSSRRESMCRLEVAVDEQIVTSLQLEDAIDDTSLDLFDGLDGELHKVQIYFPATSTLELAAVTIKSGATLKPHLPGLRWCSWGDSITQGTLCPSGRESYVQLVSNKLGWTAINRGFGGAGCPDPMTALAIACSESWDLLTIAIGVNDAALGLLKPEEFGLMYKSCLDIIQRRHPHKPIVCISPILCTMEVSETGIPVSARAAELRPVIQQVVAQMGVKTISYMDGLELLADESALVDQIHPGSEGHAQIASRLAPLLIQLTL